MKPKEVDTMNHWKRSAGRTHHEKLKEMWNIRGNGGIPMM